MESHLSYSQGQWDLVLASFVMAAFALVAAFVYLLMTHRELSARYRPAGAAGALVTLVAFLAYLLLIVSWVVGFRFDPATSTYVASDHALQFRNSYRYVDWSVTVPLLTIELVVVSTVVGRAARNLRGLLVVLAWLMIVTGFLGADTFDSTTGRLVWGLISTVVFIPLYFLVLKTAFTSAKELGEPAGPPLRSAGLLLALTWGVYPLAYCVPFFFADSAGWAVGRQLGFTLADIAAKVGFGFFIHAVAKARTGIDVAAGQDPHPDPVYVNGERRADAQPIIVKPGAPEATQGGVVPDHAVR